MGKILLAAALACAWGALLWGADAASSPPPAAGGVYAESCVVCHDGWKELKDWEISAHAANGVTCASCHGGDATATTMEAVRRGPGFRGKIPKAAVPALCGRCHSDPAMMKQYKLPYDQEQEYKLSVHGRALAGGDDRVAACADCHGAHLVLPAADARSSVNKTKVPGMCARCHADEALMAAYGLPADTYAEYAAGQHGKMLLEQQITGVPSCADCHGNHGAAPPGVAEVVNVCGNCHVNQREYYRLSPHARAAAGAPKEVCVNCHGNHRNRKPDETLYTGAYAGACGSCHGRDTGAYKRAEVIAGSFAGAKSSVAEARLALAKARAEMLEVNAWEENLKEGEAKITEAYPVAHSLDTNKINALTKEAVLISHRVEAEINHTLAEHRQRKKIAGAALAAILFLILLLFIKRHQLFKAAAAEQARNAAYSP